MRNYTTFDTYEDAKSFSVSKEQKYYYGFEKVLGIEWNEQWFCWVVYFK